MEMAGHMLFYWIYLLLAVEQTQLTHYFHHPASENLSVIDSNNMVVKTIGVGDSPVYLEYSPTTKSIYVANSDSATVTIIPP
jgi:DNA-binding beta-propeller fold protein YncE